MLKVEIYIIPIEGIDVKFTYSKNIISYHFMHNDKNYGNALNILKEGSKRPTIDDAIKGGGILMLNAIESIKSINSNGDTSNTSSESESENNTPVTE